MQTTARRRKGEGSIHYDAKRGLYVARITIDGQLKTVAAKREGDCIRKLDALKAAMRRGDVITKRVGLTVADVLDHWLKNGMRNDPRIKAPGTQLIHAANVTRWKGLIGQRPAAKLTVDDVETAYRAIAGGTDQRVGDLDRRPAGVTHQQRMGDTLRKAVRDGVRRKVLAQSVADVVVAAQIERDQAAPKGERRALTVAEMRTLIDASKSHRLHALLRLALSTGMRPGELIGLHWSDLHLDDTVPYVEVSHAAQRQLNNRFKVVEVLKNSGAYRDIGLTDDVVDVLREHRHAQNVKRLAAKSWPEPDLVFASARGTVLNPSNVRRDFDTVCTAAGLDRIVPYETRHTYATMLAESDMNTFQIADILGHANDRMLSQTYRKKRKGIVSGATAVVDRALKGDAS